MVRVRQGRGSDDFTEVSWKEANRLVAGELNRVRHDHGNRAIYAGSYGWASAGRFHHAQSQLKRFFELHRWVHQFQKTPIPLRRPKCWSRMFWGTFQGHLYTTTSWESIASDCELFIAFGGVPLKNGQISSGGTGAHVQKSGLLAAHEAGVEFVNISPLKSDILDQVDAAWLAIRPNTDVALMLGLAHVLITEDLHDRAFLDRYTTGFRPVRILFAR